MSVLSQGKEKEEGKHAVSESDFVFAQPAKITIKLNFFLKLGEY